MSGGVIGGNRWTSGVLVTDGIMLHLQKSLGIAAVGLCQRNDIGACRVGDPIGGEGLGGSVYLHHPLSQHLKHGYGGGQVILLNRHQEGVGWLLPLYCSLPDGVKIGQPAVAVAGSVGKAGKGGCEFVIDDIAQMPLPSFPWKGKVPARFFHAVSSSF